MAIVIDLRCHWFGCLFYMINKNDLSVCIFLKLEQLRRESNPNFSYQNIEDVLYKVIWKNGMPNHINDAISDIIGLTSEKVIQILSTLAIIDGYHDDLSNYEDVIGGNK